MMMIRQLIKTIRGVGGGKKGSFTLKKREDDVYVTATR